mgnify:CR=1 FL=1
MMIKKIAATAVLMVLSVSLAAQSKANPSDIVQADRFIAGLPAACSNSYKSIDSSGAVNIRVLCSGNGKTADGLVIIKDGVVTKIR